LLLARGFLFLLGKLARSLFFGEKTRLFLNAQTFGLGFLTLPRFLFHAPAHFCETMGGIFCATACGVGLAAFALFGFYTRSLFFGAPFLSPLGPLSPRLFPALALSFDKP